MYVFKQYRSICEFTLYITCIVGKVSDKCFLLSNKAKTQDDKKERKYFFHSLFHYCWLIMLPAKWIPFFRYAMLALLFCRLSDCLALTELTVDKLNNLIFNCCSEMIIRRKSKAQSNECIYYCWNKILFHNFLEFKC